MRFSGFPQNSPIRSVEVGEHQNVEQLGAESRAEGLQALPELDLEFVRLHARSKMSRSL